MDMIQLRQYLNKSILLLTIITISVLFSCDYDESNVIVKKMKNKTIITDTISMESAVLNKNADSVLKVAFIKDSKFYKKYLMKFKIIDSAFSKCKYIKHHYCYIKFRKNKISIIGNLTNNHKKIGIWKEFYSYNDYYSDSKINVTRVLEYVEPLNGINRQWLIDKKTKDTLGGAYYELVYDKNSIYKNKPFSISILYVPVNKNYEKDISDLFLLLPKNQKYLDLLKDDFSNEKEIKWDTIKNIYLRNKNKKNFNSDDTLTHLLIPKIHLKYTTSGLKKIKGIFLEKNKNKYYKMYMNEIIHVK